MCWWLPNFYKSPCVTCSCIETHTFQSPGNLTLISISFCVCACLCSFRLMASCGECDSRDPIWIHLWSLKHTHMHTYRCICTDIHGWLYARLVRSFDSNLEALEVEVLCWWTPLTLTLSSLNGSQCWELIWGTLRIPRLHGTKIHTTWLCSF